MHHITRGQLEHRFGYHKPPDAETAAAHGQVRQILLDAADAVVEQTGPSTREQSLAVTKLEEAMFWANAAIARNAALTHPPDA
jgi:hypothetical protein